MNIPVRMGRKFLKKKKNERVLTSPNMKMYYGVTLIKSGWLWCKPRYSDQWNRTKRAEIKASAYEYFLYDKGDILHQWSKITL